MRHSMRWWKESAYQTLVSVGSGPLNQLFGCGNSLAFAVGSLAAFVSELVAIVGLAPQFITNGSTTILQRGQTFQHVIGVSKICRSWFNRLNYIEMAWNNWGFCSGIYYLSSRLQKFYG